MYYETSLLKWKKKEDAVRILEKSNSVMLRFMRASICKVKGCSRHVACI